MSTETKEQVSRQILEEKNTIRAANERLEDLQTALEVIQSKPEPACMFGYVRPAQQPRIFIDKKVFSANDGMIVSGMGTHMQYHKLYDLSNMWDNGKTPIWVCLTVKEAEWARGFTSEEGRSFSVKAQAALEAYKK